ncbi:MAG: flavin reductase family protein [Actinobacteria bacterium]|nr:flavin reductase family protein [Actinomycetota bacterium]
MGPAEGDGPEQERAGGGASLHFGDPWGDPPTARDPLRRLRGHLVLPVTVWTAEVAPRHQLVGLTVSSVLLAQGDPGVLAGLLAPLSDLAGLLEKPGTRFVVHVLGANHRRLAQHFAGELPAPEEVLATTTSTYGPVLQAVADRALCTSYAAKPFGWSLMVEAVIEEVQVAQAGGALAWHHGNYRVVST